MTRKYKSVNIDELLHSKLKECAEKLSEEHGFKISQTKAISILVYRFFNGTSSYDKPQSFKGNDYSQDEIIEEQNRANQKIIKKAGKSKQGNTANERIRSMPPIEEAVKQAVKDAKMPVCKIHGTPLTENGKCLQKGCKYA